MDLGAATIFQMQFLFGGYSAGKPGVWIVPLAAFITPPQASKNATVTRFKVCNTFSNDSISLPATNAVQFYNIAWVHQKLLYCAITVSPSSCTCLNEWITLVKSQSAYELYSRKTERIGSWQANFVYMYVCACLCVKCKSLK